MGLVLSRRPTAFARQSEMKTGAPPGVGVGPQTSSVCFDDGPTDWQAHTGAVSLGGEERAENLFRLLRWQSDPRITYRDQQLAILHLLRPYRKFAGGGYVLHGVDAVNHQVHEYLLQLDTVCHDRGQILGQLGADQN